MKGFFSLALLALGVSAQSPPRGTGFPQPGGSRLITFNETVPSTRLAPRSVSLAWVEVGNDGDYISSAGGALVITNAGTGVNSTFVSADRVPDDYYDYWISSDASRVLWATNYTKQYRHSYFANYQILDVASGELTPLVADQVGDIQYAEWSPDGSRIAFVRGNDLYVWTDGQVARITENGGPDTFNGVPDWVMEEEILGDRYSLWWSPDSTKIAYLSFDERGVGEFTIPYYAANTKYGPSYPRELPIRYPKVGTTNPKVAFNLLDVESSAVTNVPIDAFPADDLIIGEVAWATEDSSNVLYRAYNRVQDAEKVVNVNAQDASSSVIRERAESTGWLDNNLSIQYVGAIGGNSTNGTLRGEATYYIDVSDVSGWNHVYLFPVNGGEPRALTTGEFEVRAILKVDTTRGLVYFTSTERHSTESHLYSVSYRTGTKTALVDDTKPGYWSASFSAGGSYWSLSYQGPDVPYQELYSVNSTTPLRTLEDNSAFIARIAEYNLPEVTWFELDHPDGSKLNVMQRLPANFDASRQYPVLFTPYGGPGAQNTGKQWKALNWNTYAASDPELEYVQWTVDNRGTGYKGRAFRAQVTNRLGQLEAEDQVFAARELQKQPFVDANHFAHWGWSYGGYLTAKVVELDSGVFQLGLITAPVTDWRFYDTMYTERYMKTPALNEAGYNASAVRKTQGFKTIAGGFQITHGLGDDNVHYQHTAVLTNLLMGEGVGPQTFENVFFSDSDHSIRYNGDGTFLYKTLTKRLFEEKRRTTGLVSEVHQWSKKDKVGRRWDA
ncbi:Dipeptidyl peptidase-like protein [Elsinoe fawcettii]|nr:Dipeptidyl peptidase-like protein [Elsinoe fawcettii]